MVGSHKDEMPSEVLNAFLKDSADTLRRAVICEGNHRRITKSIDRCDCPRFTPLDATYDLAR